MLPSMFFCSVLCIAACTIVTRAANILVFMPLPMKSHFRGFQPLFEELAHRGHNVTVASSFPLDRPLVNYTDVGPFVNKGRLRNVMELVHMNFVTSVQLKWDLGIRMSDSVMSHENMKNFVQSSSNSFDLVIIETFCQEYTVAMGHKYNAPVINLSPAMPWVSVSKWLDVPATYSYIPDMCLQSTGDMGFIERLKNTISGLMQSYADNFVYFPKMKETMDTYITYDGWESRPPLEQMLKNVSLTLVNSNYYAIGVARPYLPGIVEVGGMHIKPPNPLPENLQIFLDAADEGAIFFSFGSIINLNDLPNEKLEIVLSVIQKLKQKVIIKWTPNDGVKLSENIMTGSWFPQNDILAHPNVKLFITHGGLHSIEETISNAIPVVGIPFFADQYLNMKIAEEKGYGKLVNFFEMTEESFGNAVKELLSNVMYKETAKVQSQVFKDQPMKPLDLAVYWVEYVIRNGGAEHLISGSIELNDAQYFLLDISLILFVLIGLIIWLCYLVVAKAISKKLNTD
ncbi:2-hydroxyacylsphingosine 1-beta-galactosyltransferase-like isoform X1 [Myzus persicae]|uniref:2-hydroxyacylsphingosine 1-beta-galactosyltransferase-like isoform X1 n=2 Tax=Myzus persicae TaxID=13164 RepID=UPI000B938DFC|nr:2-hydroxyacylsphingosine 1-beta-galactosyltransferase-like isoform X1 [Myzus persicae]